MIEHDPSMLAWAASDDLWPVEGDGPIDRIGRLLQRLDQRRSIYSRDAVQSVVPDDDCRAAALLIRAALDDQRFAKLVVRIANWTDAECDVVDARQVRHVATSVVVAGADPHYPPFGQVGTSSEDWQPIATWQGQPTGQAHTVILCVSDDGKHPPVVGEAWFDPESYGGTWWWANTSQDDYHADPIVDCQHGVPTFWQPKPAPPRAAMHVRAVDQGSDEA